MSNGKVAMLLSSTTLLASLGPELMAEDPVKIVITRQASSEKCTVGQIAVGGKIVGYTLERPWEGNLPIISSIPAGRYSGFLRRATSDRWRVELENVPERHNVQIHVGNFVPDTIGCVLVGTEVKPDDCVIADSKTAFDRMGIEILGALAGRPENEPSSLSVTILDTPKKD